MKRLSLIYSIVLSAGIVLSLSSCSEDDGPTPDGTAVVSLAIAGSGSTTVTSGRLASGRTNAEVVIDDFQISIRDVIFKTDVDDDGVADDSTDVAFRGPYALDLASEAGALEQSLGDAEIPLGVYEELRFKLHKTRDVAQDHPLFDRSIYISGTIDGTPFVMWHDTSENLDVGKRTGVVVDEDGVSVSVNFTIAQFFNGIDLSTATDVDQDGVIEIDPDDEDGNKDFADLLKDNIKAAADLLDEQ